MKAVIAVAFALALAAGAYFLFWSKAPGPQAPRHGGAAGFSIPVEAEPVKIESLARTVPAVGTLRSIESVVVRTEVPGLIADIAFKEGRPVKKGDVLVRLDDSIARAELNQARASLELSKANYQRASKLFAQKVGSAQARDQALANMKVDEARVAVAKARLDKTVIRAPFDGIVGLKKVSPGDYVDSTREIVNLEKIDVLKVDFSVPELTLPALALGQTVNVSVDALPGRSFEGKVYAMDPLVDARGRSIAIRAHIDNARGELRPGLFARVELVTARIENALVVPEEAIVPIGQNRFVFRVDQGKAVMVKVATGLRRPGAVQITSGLNPGDVVVTAGQIKLRDKTPVTVIKPGAQSKGTAGAAAQEGK